MTNDLRESKPNGNGTGAVREYFTKWIESIIWILEERDKRYTAQFNAQETAVAAALSAQKELNRIIAEASDKAIVKAENAQHDYNMRSNEFRDALADQAKVMSRDMLSRNEYLTQHASLQLQVTSQKEDIALLRSIVSQIQISLAAKDVLLDTRRSDSRWTTSTLIAVFFSTASLLIALIVLVREIFK